ncbi:hypothetical protein ACFQ7A_11190 [Streptomyces sp. NPDC056528]|uniref:hypothetical protein n=1 Tax=Streptomyces sp. NPDC056528 TaxID=3345854 RepID=UPI00368D4395
MNGLIAELLAQGASWYVALPLLLLMSLIVLVRTLAAGIAVVLKAMHPGDSADAVRMQADRIRHRQFKARRRDGNRRARIARRACVRAGVRAWFHRRRNARVTGGPIPEIVLPGLVLPPEDLTPRSGSRAALPGSGERYTA